MMAVADHLIIMPIVLPTLAGAALLLINERWRVARIVVHLTSTALLLAVAIALLRAADTDAIAVYLPGNWPVPLGIALACDRLSALMLLLTALLGIASSLYAFARWDRAGAHFLPISQFQLLGLNGAFLTADLFNLFVFFELMLAASYGLVLHGSGGARVRAGFHYLIVNLTSASVFLLGISLIYAVTGTLNLADIARRISMVGNADLGLLRTGVALLGVVFLVKAAAWPINFWLPPAYRAASAPVACLFALMTKVGIYALLRLGSVFLDDPRIAVTDYQWLRWIGLATLAYGVLGICASRSLSRLGGYLVIVSSGTLLAAIGVDRAAVTAGALFYLINSTLAIGAYFLLVEMVEQARNGDTLHPADQTRVDEPVEEGARNAMADVDIVGVPIAAATAFLGLSFVGCALLLSGLPPLSGFVAKFELLSALLGAPQATAGGSLALSVIAGDRSAIALFVLLLASGLAIAVAMTRAGIRSFWASSREDAARVRLNEAAAVTMLLAVCVALTIWASPVTRYLQAVAEALQSPGPYIEAVLGATAVKETPPTALEPAGASARGAKP